MQIYPNRLYISIQPSFWISCAFCLLLFPARWLFSWIIAALLHESAHLCVLLGCKIKIVGVQLRFWGADLYTEPVSARIEFFSALAGPVSGLVLTCFYRYIPTISVCAFLQTFSNMIPIGHRDGVRILRCVYLKLLGAEKGEKASILTERIIITSFILLIGFFCAYLKYVIPLLFIGAFYLLKLKTPCKENRQIVQYGHKIPKR